MLTYPAYSLTKRRQAQKENSRAGDPQDEKRYIAAMQVALSCALRKHIRSTGSDTLDCQCRLSGLARLMRREAAGLSRFARVR